MNFQLSRAIITPIIYNKNDLFNYGFNITGWLEMTPKTDSERTIIKERIQKLTERNEAINKKKREINRQRKLEREAIKNDLLTEQQLKTKMRRLLKYKERH